MILDNYMLGIIISCLAVVPWLRVGLSFVEFSSLQNTCIYLYKVVHYIQYKFVNNLSCLLQELLLFLNNIVITNVSFVSIHESEP